MPERSLAAYLSLPLDQYALLDPDWISRQAGASDLFVLRLPLFDMVGLDLQPQLSVRVALDPHNSQVRAGVQGRAAAWCCAGGGGGHVARPRPSCAAAASTGRHPGSPP